MTTALARTARFLRERRRMTQRAAAEALGISFVHLSNIERGRSAPSAALAARFREIFGGDLHILSWCLYEDDAQVPEALRSPRQMLAEAWQRELSDPETRH